MATQTGKPIIFGYTGTDGLVETTLTGKILLQGHSYEKDSPGEVQLKGADGKLATRVFPEDMEKATIETIVTGTDVATAITNKTAVLGLRHTIISITTCASAPELVRTNWFVTAVKPSGSNAEAHKVTLEVEAYSGITASAA